MFSHREPGIANKENNRTVFRRGHVLVTGRRLNPKQIVTFSLEEEQAPLDRMLQFSTLRSCTCVVTAHKLST